MELRIPLFVVYLDKTTPQYRWKPEQFPGIWWTRVLGLHTAALEIRRNRESTFSHNTVSQVLSSCPASSTMFLEMFRFPIVSFDSNKKVISFSAGQFNCSFPQYKLAMIDLRKMK